MAEATQYQFTHKEVVEALVRKQGLTEGIWTLTLTLGLSVGNTGPDIDNLNPTAMVAVGAFGLSKTTEMTNLAIDASTLSRDSLERSRAIALGVRQSPAPHQW